MNTLNGLNVTLTEVTSTIKEAKELRVNSIADVISTLIAEAKADVTLTTLSARNRNKAICEYYLASNDMDVYFKRSVKIAYSIFDGYKIRHTMLSIATMEKLVKLPKDIVNDVYASNDIENYAEAIKELISDYTFNISKGVKTFQAPKKS
mgnify:FL=1